MAPRQQTFAEQEEDESSQLQKALSDVASHKAQKANISQAAQGVTRTLGRTAEGVPAAMAPRQQTFAEQEEDESPQLQKALTDVAIAVLGRKATPQNETDLEGRPFMAWLKKHPSSGQARVVSTVTKRYMIAHGLFNLQDGLVTLQSGLNAKQAKNTAAITAAVIRFALESARQTVAEESSEGTTAQRLELKLKVTNEICLLQAFP